ncbi:hypothetical protein [Sphingopyxis panaciterrulae]|uniref:Uncharacterized protein n=1 Tax=Sphingopyxis panaciterrulae TaxID=462372 RepID=A0A7W9ES51_9SPHN|nr:hypothetical protein [Sphingopyxis panaciterrulae]MBB5708329.1 hypothetical protein [Sphingopyxis panaciterrulae]
MARKLTILVTCVAAGLFAWAIALVRLFDAFQPLIVALSIMVAAIFVRLNRGMPTLEWKSADPEERKKLTSAIVGVTTEYGWILGLNATVLAGLVSLSVVGEIDAALWPEWVRRVTSGAVGALIALCTARMAYVVWRDIDIVRLQKRLIDGSAAKEVDQQEGEAADANVTVMKKANLRAVKVQPPKAWGK